MSWPAKGKSRLPTASKMQDASGENGNSHTGSLITAQTCLQPKQDQNRSDSNATLQPHNHVFILRMMKPTPLTTASRTLKTYTWCIDTGPAHPPGLQLNYHLPT